VKSFTAEVSQLFRGETTLSKSFGEIAEDFTIPAMNVTATLKITDIEGYPTYEVFGENDIVELRPMNRTSTGLILGSVFGIVTGGVDNGDGTQSWQFETLHLQAGALAGQIVRQGSESKSYGSELNPVGVIQDSVFSNSPYRQIYTWVTDPWTVANREVTYQHGDLSILQNPNVGGVGVYSENSYFTGLFLAGDVSKVGTYFEVDTGVLTAKLDQLFITAVDEVTNVGIKIDSNVPQIHLGVFDPDLSPDEQTWEGVFQGMNGGVVEHYVGEFTTGVLDKGMLYSDGSFKIKADDLLLEAIEVRDLASDRGISIDSANRWMYIGEFVDIFLSETDPDSMIWKGFFAGQHLGGPSFRVGEFSLGDFDLGVMYEDGALQIKTPNFSIDALGDVFINGTMTNDDGDYVIGSDGITISPDTSTSASYGADRSLKFSDQNGDIIASIEGMDDQINSYQHFAIMTKYDMLFNFEDGAEWKILNLPTTAGGGSLNKRVWVDNGTLKYS